MKDIKVAVIMPHSGCNMFCSFCITENDFDSMSLEQGMSLLEYLKGLNVKNLVVGGGEPFCWPHIISFCREAKRMGFFVQIGTNCLLLPMDFEYAEYCDRFVIPLEAANEKIHNELRIFADGHYGLIKDCLAKLKAAGKSVTVSTVITSVNAGCITELGEFLRDYNKGTEHIHAWHLYRFIPKGRGGSLNGELLNIPEETYDEICASAKNMCLPFHVFKRTNMYNSKTVEFFQYENGALRSSESFGRS